MKIGVVFHGNPLAGGGFHDGLSSTLLVANLEKDFDFAFYTPDLENAKSAKKAGLQTKLIKFGRLHKLGYKARKKILYSLCCNSLKGYPHWMSNSKKMVLLSFILRAQTLFVFSLKD